MSEKIKQSSIIAIIFFWGLCYYFGSLAYARLGEIEERNVTLKDVGMTIKSLKDEKYTSFIGYYIDQKTGNTFSLDITYDEYKIFERTMTPFETKKIVSLDRAEKDSAGTVYALLAALLGSVGLTLTMFFLMGLIEEKSNNKSKMY